MAPTEALCAYVIKTRFEQIPVEHRELAKLRVIDVIGCAIGASNDQGNPQIVDLIKSWGGVEEATVLGYGVKLPAHQTALINSVLARSFDFEALGPVVDGKSIPAHISGTTVITALAMAESEGRSGEEFLSALMVGDDLVCRILAASGHGGLPPGWDHVGTSNAFGAAAIAARLSGLDPIQLRHAFGIAVNQMSGTMQNIWDGSPVFKLLQGLSSQNGIFSARLANAGWTGADEPLLGNHGFYDLFTKGCQNSDILTKKLGTVFYSDEHFKPYPCCAVSQSAIDCALEIREKGDIGPNEIAEIELFVTQGGLDSFLNQPVQIKEHPHTSVAFNYRYPVASALIRGRLIPAHFSEKAIRDEAVQRLAEKIRLSLIQDETADLLSSSLKVTMINGEIFTAEKDFPKGDPLRYPLSREEIIAKYRENIEYSNLITKDNAEKALGLIQKIEELERVDELLALLVP